MRLVTRLTGRLVFVSTLRGYRHRFRIGCFAAALAQGLVAMIAVLLNGFFVVLFVLSASLFRNSARANGPHTQRC